MPDAPITLTAVIATLNDARVLGRTIHRALNECGFDEVIVVDGGSTDNTLQLARDYGARAYLSEPIRGHQLDDGWKAATTELICFIRPDTELPSGAGDQIRRAFRDETVTLTSFRLGYQSRRRELALLAAWFNFRAQLLGHPSGMQAVTVRREDLAALGGLPYWHECEDLYLISNMKRRGRSRILNDHVYIRGDGVLKKGVVTTWWDDIREALLYTRHKIPSYLRK